MNSLRKSRRFTAAVVVFLLAAGAVATNHCALAALGAEPQRHSCCHEDDSPSTRPMQCCDALSAPIPESAVVPDCPVAPVPLDLPPMADRADMASPEFEQAIFARTLGPPGGFYLGILQRTGCFRAHAPPAFFV